MTNLFTLGGDFYLNGRTYSLNVWGCVVLMLLSAVCGAATDLAFDARGYFWQVGWGARCVERGVLAEAWISYMQRLLKAFPSMAAGLTLCCAACCLWGPWLLLRRSSTAYSPRATRCTCGARWTRSRSTPATASASASSPWWVRCPGSLPRALQRITPPCTPR